MLSKIEIIPRFASEEEADKLLYTPRAPGVRYRNTKTCLCETSGDAAAFVAWMRRVLLDEVSQDFHLGDAPALGGAEVILEYGMKPGALDHEREMILEEYHREGEDALGFTILDLRLRTRIYLFGPADPAPFIKDIVNPAIHSHRVI